jgi:hypothetical protein
MQDMTPVNRLRIPLTDAVTNRVVILLSIFGNLRLSLLTVCIFGFEVILFGSLGTLSPKRP